MKKLSPILLIVGLTALAVGILMPILTNNILSNIFRYIFAAGAALTLIARLFAPAPSQGIDIRTRRLLRLEQWSALLYCVAAFFVFYSYPTLRDWLAFTMAGASIQVYVSLALSLKKNKKK